MDAAEYEHVVLGLIFLKYISDAFEEIHQKLIAGEGAYEGADPDFPAEHWKHLRTTNPIESTFATIRLRHRRTKGSGTRRASLAIMFKLGKAAEQG